MPKNYLLVYSEQLATDIELLCQNIKAPSNTLFQIRKSSSSVYANIREANYGQSRADMLSKFEIALKECSETEGWLKLLLNTEAIDEKDFKRYRNLCGRIKRMLIASCKTLRENILQIFIKSNSLALRSHEKLRGVQRGLESYLVFSRLCRGKKFVIALTMLRGMEGAGIQGGCTRWDNWDHLANGGL